MSTQQNKVEVAWGNTKQQEWQKEHERIKHCLDNNIPVSNYPPPPLTQPKEPEKGGVKHDSGKPDLSMISYELMEQIALVRMFGEKKYSRDNWKKGFLVTRSCAAALRHIFKFLSGETLDPESGLSHLSHAVCSLEHAMYDMIHHPENDNR